MSQILDLVKESNVQVVNPIVELVDSLKSFSFILDGGCGSGSFPFERYKHGIVGIDLNSRSFKYCDMKNVHLMKGDIECIPSKSEIFDLAICNFVLEHVKNPRKCLEDLHRVLKRTGLVLISIPNSSSFDDKFYNLWCLFRWGKLDHIQKYTLESFCKLAIACGFKLISFYEWKTGFTYLRSTPRFQGLVIKMITTIKKYVGKDLFRNSNWIILLGLENTVVKNYFEWTISHICRNCGVGIRTYQKSWICPICDTINTNYISPIALLEITYILIDTVLTRAKKLIS